MLSIGAAMERWAGLVVIWAKRSDLSRKVGVRRERLE